MLSKIEGMKKTLRFLICITALLSLHLTSRAQGVSVNDYPMPQGHRSGLVRPGFRIAPTLKIEKLGEIHSLVLYMDVQMGTARNPVGPFSYRYMRDGQIYTDQQLGPNPFNSISLGSAVFTVRVQGPGINTEVRYNTNLDRQEVGKVAGNEKASNYAAFVQQLVDVYYKGTEDVNGAITSLQNTTRKKQEEEKRLAAAKQTADQKKINDQKVATQKLAQQQARNQATAKTAAGQQTANTGSANTASGSTTTAASRPNNTTAPASAGLVKSGIGQVIPKQPGHDKLPNLVRTTDGGYFQKGADGSFVQVSEQQYLQAQQAQKNAAAASAQNTALQKQQAEKDRVARELAALESQRQANAELTSAISSGIENLGSMVAAGIREDAQRKAEREERYSLIREQNRIKGESLLRLYKEDALKGNEEAISQVIQGYYLMDAAEDQRVFMESMLTQYNSPAAGRVLTSFYTNRINYYKSESNRHLRRGVGKLVLFSLGGALLFNAANSIDIYEEPEREGEYDALTYASGGAFIFGTISSLASFMKVGYKNKPEYVQAQAGLSGVQQRMKIAFMPKLDFRNNSHGLALRASF